jgi:hypothetical protein
MRHGGGHTGGAADALSLTRAVAQRVGVYSVRDTRAWSMNTRRKVS